MNRWTRFAGFACMGAVGFLAACQEAPVGLDDQPVELMASLDPDFGDIPGMPGTSIGVKHGVAEYELYEVCKLWVGPGPHPVATFDISVDRDRDGVVDLTFTRTSDDLVNAAADGSLCLDIWNQGGGAQGGWVTVTEQALTDYTTTVAVTTIDNGTPTVAPVAVPGGMSALIGGSSIAGATVLFTNTYVPPPGGGEGCTPGYWRQPHHYDSWVGYSPDDLFSDVFEDAFPGQTLGEVVKARGGGLNALGRHTVAALLNTTSAGVDYDLTEAGVIAAFNAVFPGSKNDYNTLKNEFAGFNEQGCSLN